VAQIGQSKVIITRTGGQSNGELDAGAERGFLAIMLLTYLDLKTCDLPAHHQIDPGKRQFQAFRPVEDLIRNGNRRFHTKSMTARE
jgi:hypothetical protein